MTYSHKDNCLAEAVSNHERQVKRIDQNDHAAVMARKERSLQRRINKTSSDLLQDPCAKAFEQAALRAASPSIPDKF